MAQKKITDLTLRDEVSAEVNFPGDDGIQTYRMTAAQIKAYILSSGVIEQAMLATQVVQHQVPTGAQLAFAGSVAPSGYLFCYGQAVSRTTYEDLFDAIGTAYGAGDGTTTFNIPDKRGRTSVGKDDMGGSAASRVTNAVSGINGATLGANGGAQSVTLSITEMPSHTHTQNSHTHNIPLYYSDQGTGQVTRPRGCHLTGGAFGNYGTDAQTATNQNTGGGGAHNNMQPTEVDNWIIKT